MSDSLVNLTKKAERLTKQLAGDCTNACRYEDPRDACHRCRSSALIRDLLAYATTVSQERDEARKRLRVATDSVPCPACDWPHPNIDLEGYICACCGFEHGCDDPTKWAEQWNGKWWADDERQPKIVRSLEAELSTLRTRAEQAEEKLETAIGFYPQPGFITPCGLAMKLELAYGFARDLPPSVDRRDIINALHETIRILKLYHDSKPHCDWPVRDTEREPFGINGEQGAATHPQETPK